ncbi:MAG: tRNA preQ1(34) S-adenosylmethionine ribosyltransferase-isomerase QueA [Nitrospiraceae bacterium]
MLLSDFDFPFDSTLIASEPILPRDQARLMVMDRQSARLDHCRVGDLPTLLSSGDVVVVNDTKVMAARVTGRKYSQSKLLELLFVREVDTQLWEVFLKGHIKQGDVIDFTDGVRAVVVERGPARTTVRVEGSSVRDLMNAIGQMPLPPYIKRQPTPADHVWYQTSFARHEGAIAAPTAGLHFTPAVLDALHSKGILVAKVTLHVGPGTFRPVATDRIEEHQMEPERVKLTEETAQIIGRAKAAGGRIVAVGTTVVRTLESAVDEIGQLHGREGLTNLFIVPGYRFRVVDALVTNFHLPRTTLLMLVAAFGGLESIRAAYQEAIRVRYRFYSYGDAMLIL